VNANLHAGPHQRSGQRSIPTDERVVIDGKYVTGAGVSAGTDMALTLAGIIAGEDVAKTLQLATEYAPQPPYDSGTVPASPPALVEALTSRRDDVLWADL
jgi:transcriptional regulator GlxA family with amidase domain